uniref:Histone-lysine N-methyltransferase PRDM9-like n=1 Tax=Phallusia mammillata TaxID=59560 RepID=A0A6F9DNX2_9ASCI|nr:histone-lysine N-methyltransferase PRDM9-like [Phallusia mammillata]
MADKTADWNEDAERVMKLFDEWNGFERVPTNEILEKVKMRISLEKLFKPDEYEKLCKFEKKRIRNIGNNLTVMMYLGMPLPPENTLRAKVGLPPRGGFKAKISSDSESDEDWKPYRPPQTTKKMPGFLSVTDLLRRKKFITKNCMIDNEKHIDAPESEALKNVKKNITLPPKEQKKKKPSSEKQKTRKKTTATENDEPRYPKRDIVRKTYKEPEVPTEDDFLFCDECEKLHLGDCPVHGAYNHVPDTLVKMGLKERARRTCPKGISIGLSGIRSGGKGAWCDQEFQKNTVFGPYEGVIVSRNNLSQLEQLFEGGYAWEIYKKGKLSHYIDGNDVKNSNWLRYINCARNEEEQNVIAYQYKGRIYYRLYKPVTRGVELLVWYGKQYAEHLGIPTEYKQKIAEIKELLKPQICLDDYSPCNICDKIFINDVALNKHMKWKHPDRSVVKQHKCPWCDYSTDKVGHLKVHERTHTNEKPFQCEICQKRFSQLHVLKTHALIHSGVKPHKCKVCGKCFTQLGDLRKHHKTVHEKSAEYLCQICGEKFGHAGHLKTHIRIHTGEKPYPCKYCEKKFNQSSILQRHERTHNKT